MKMFWLSVAIISSSFSVAQAQVYPDSTFNHFGENIQRQQEQWQAQAHYQRQQQEWESQQRQQQQELIDQQRRNNYLMQQQNEMLQQQQEQAQRPRTCNPITGVIMYGYGAVPC